MNAGLSHEQYVMLANNSLRTLGFKHSSELFMDDLAKRIARWGIPDIETTEKECYLYLIEMEAQCGLEFRTEPEFINREGECAGFISVVKQDDETSLAQIPYSFDKETGDLKVKLPQPLRYARDVFDRLTKEIEENHCRELRHNNKKKFWEREER